MSTDHPVQTPPPAERAGRRARRPGKNIDSAAIAGHIKTATMLYLALGAMGTSLGLLSALFKWTELTQITVLFFMLGNLPTPVTIALLIAGPLFFGIGCGLKRRHPGAPKWAVRAAVPALLISGATSVALFTGSAALGLLGVGAGSRLVMAVGVIDGLTACSLLFALATLAPAAGKREYARQVRQAQEAQRALDQQEPASA